MGLDADVYKNIRCLDLRGLDEFAKIDVTGDVYFDDANHGSHFPSEYFEAYSARIGNAAFVRSLDTYIKKGSLLYYYFVSNPLGSDMTIPLSEFDKLEAEVSAIEVSSAVDSDAGLRHFLTVVRRLLKEGRQQRNPIVLL